MNDLTKSNSGELVSLLHGKGGNPTVPKPFERDIFLFDTHVAGTSHIDGIEDLEPHMHIEDRLEFYREPNNSHDSRAIVIRNDKGIKIGYIPKADNAVFSRLMDAGKLLFGRIASKEMSGNWLNIKIKVYLHE